MNNYIVFTRNGNVVEEMDTMRGALALCAHLHNDYGYNGNAVFVYSVDEEIIISHAEDGIQRKGKLSTKKHARDILETALFAYYERNI